MKSRERPFFFPITSTCSCLFLVETFSFMDLMERYTLENSITRFMVLQPVVTGTHKAREERGAANSEPRLSSNESTECNNIGGLHLLP